MPGSHMRQVFHLDFIVYIKGTQTSLLDIFQKWEASLSLSIRSPFHLST